MATLIDIALMLLSALLNSGAIVAWTLLGSAGAMMALARLSLPRHTAAILPRRERHFGRRHLEPPFVTAAATAHVDAHRAGRHRLGLEWHALHEPACRTRGGKLMFCADHDVNCGQ